MPTTERSQRPVLAVVQTCPVRGDLDANTDQHLHLAQKAAAAGAQLALFPELSLTGYELDLAPDLAFSTEDPRLTPLVTGAVELGITMIVGAPVRLGTSLHIGAFILQPEGQVGLYTKRRLGAFPPDAVGEGAVPPPEATVFEPGDLDPLVQVAGRTAALAICADIGDGAHPLRAATRGADAYLVGMFIIPSDYDADTARLAGYARNHAMLVAAANFGGPSGGLPAAGGSAAWSGDGTLLLRLDESGVGFGLVTETPRGWAAVRSSR